MKKIFFALGLLIFFFGSSLAHAATRHAPFEVSGWIPYWRSATGTTEALVHLDDFKEVNPFGYTVKTNGGLYDAANLDGGNWQYLQAIARQKGIRFIPTIMWSNTAAMQSVLSSRKLRTNQILQIVDEVNAHGFDGIDIDYENKSADTKPYFSLFIKELSQALGPNKWLECTIEARTPMTSVMKSVPRDYVPAYANDYAVLNRYCDRVRIMTYDQASVDLKLTSSTDQPYVPVSDPRWVEKVINLASQSISKNKIMIGVPTYGYEFQVKPLTEGYNYKLLWAFNPKYATDLASSLGIAPQRNIAGELSFVYRPTSTVAVLGNTSISGATFNIVWWSDAQAIKDKIDLAKRLGVRGISIFKIDGGADSALWDILNQYK